MTTIPVSNLLGAVADNHNGNRASGDNLYTEVNDLPEILSLGRSMALTPGSVQRLPPPLPPVPLFFGPGNQMVKRSASLNCVLDDQGSSKRPTAKMLQEVHPGSKEAEYDDLLVVKADGVHRGSDEYQLMQKAVNAVDVLKTGLESKVMFLTSKYADVQNELSKTQRSLAECQKMVSDLYQTVTSIQLHLASPECKQSCSDIERSEAGESQANKSRLLTMTTDEVLSLLTVLGLKQYKKIFQRERINGRFLLECDEEILKTDLGITNKLHRMRLMMFIAGKQCAYTVIKQGVD